MNFIYKMCINSFTLGCPSRYYGKKTAVTTNAAKTVKKSTIVTGLQDNVTKDVNQDGQELRVITVHLFYCLNNLSFTFKK